MELASLTGTDTEAGAYDAAVLGVGATEYHGPHLPYGSDTLIAHALSRRVAAHFPRMVVLPPVAHGVSLHHMGFPWTLSLRPQTLADTIYDIAASLHAGGLRKLLVVTAHDGNAAPVEIAARNLHHDLGMHVAAMLGWQGRARRVLASSPRVRQFRADRAAGVGRGGDTRHGGGRRAHPPRGGGRRATLPACAGRERVVTGGVDAFLGG